MEAIRTPVGERPRLRALAPELVAGGALAATVAASYALAAGLATSSTFFVSWSQRPGFGFPAWLAGPLKGTGIHLTISRFLFLMIGLFALYLLVLRFADSVRLSWAVGALVALHVVWMLAPPMWLTDVFNYLGYLRLGARHGMSPYTHYLAAAPHDPAFRWVTWPKLHSPYGPLFLAGFWPLAFVSVPAGLWAFKVATTAAALGCLALVVRLARELGRPVVPALLFVGLNPLWLVYGVGGAHNDAFMLLFLLAGILLAVRGREALAGGAMVLGAAVKGSGGLLLPFLFIGARNRRKVVLGAIAAGALVLAITVAFFPSSPLHALVSFANQGDNISYKSFPGQVGQVLFGADNIGSTAERIANLLVLVAVVGLLVRAWRGADWLEQASWATLALLLSLVWLMPWYVVWLLPLAAIVADRRLRIVALAFCTFVILLYIP